MNNLILLRNIGQERYFPPVLCCQNNFFVQEPAQCPHKISDTLFFALTVYFTWVYIKLDLFVPHEKTLDDYALHINVQEHPNLVPPFKDGRNVIGQRRAFTI